MAISPLRFGVVLLAFAAGTLALIARIGYIQVIEHPEFVRQADESHWARQSIAPLRGSIKDRNGHPLVLSSSSWDLSLDFSHVPGADIRTHAAAAVARATGISEDVLA